MEVKKSVKIVPKYTEKAILMSEDFGNPYTAEDRRCNDSIGSDSMIYEVVEKNSVYVDIYDTDIVAEES